MNPIQADSLDFVYIGQLIRKYRVNNGYTQAHLADMVNIDASYISKIERGKKVRLSTLVSISSALGFSLDEIKRSSFQKEAGIRMPPETVKTKYYRAIKKFKEKAGEVAK